MAMVRPSGVGACTRPGRKHAAACNAAPDASSFVRAHLLQLEPYTPILPFEVLSAQLGRDPKDIIKLDANENPYGPPQEVLDALGSLTFPNIYPDPEARALRTKLAALNDVDMDLLLVGCGADELIDLLMRVVLEEGEFIVDTPPTFTMYAFDAAVNNAKSVAVTRNPDFSLDIAGIKAAVAETSAKIVFVTSPNNPDGSLTPDDDILELLKLPVLVVLDEAYIEFADGPHHMKWVEEHSNLVVLRTFSKSAGLAGLRVGYGAFPKGLVEYMWAAKQPYNVSVAAEMAALAALGAGTYMQDVRDLLVAGRKTLYERLQGVSFLEPYPSHANFVLCKVNGRDAGEVKDTLARDHGIMVRHYTKPELSGYIRISVGTTEQIDVLMRVLEGME